MSQANKAKAKTDRMHRQVQDALHLLSQSQPSVANDLRAMFEQQRHGLQLDFRPAQGAVLGLAT